LRSVAVMHIPVDDEHAIETLDSTRVVCGDGDVSEEAESHRGSTKRVVAGRAHRAEAALRRTREREVDGVEDASGARRGGLPRTRARDRVGVELAAALLRERTNTRDVRRVVREGDLVVVRVPPLEMVERFIQLEIVAQCARNRAKPADVLGMTPARVMPTAVGVRDERDGLLHRAPRQRRDAHSASRQSNIAGRSHRGNPCGPDASGAIATAGPSASTRRASGAPSAAGDSSAGGSGAAGTLATMRDPHARGAATASAPPCMRQRHVSSKPACSTRPAPSRRAATVNNAPRVESGTASPRSPSSGYTAIAFTGSAMSNARTSARRLAPARAGAIARTAGALAAPASSTRPPPCRTNRTTDAATDPSVVSSATITA